MWSIIPSRSILPSMGVVGGAVVGGVAALTVAPWALPLLGFAKTGVVVSSIAAGVQSTIGNVAAGSMFAALQSAGATGVIGVTAKATVVIVGGAAGAVYGKFMG